MEEERKGGEFTEQEVPEQAQSDAQMPLEDQPLISEEGYRPRPTYQKVLAWVLLGIVIVGIILWYLEIATAGSLFGLLG